jgi:flap endonuclease-1
MGVKGLAKFVEKYGTQIFLDDLQDKTIAIDIHIYLYKFKYSKKNLVSCFKNQINRFSKVGITPIYIFDGIKPPLKDAVIKKRKDKNGIFVTREEISDVKLFFEQENIRYIIGVSEGEKTCSNLNRREYSNIYAVLSNDYDCLAFNCKRLVVYKSGEYIMYDTDNIISDLDISLNDFIDICIISGTDYSYGVKGTGIIKAFKKLKSSDLNDLLKEIENYEEIKNIFIDFEKEKMI